MPLRLAVALVCVLLPGLSFTAESRRVAGTNDEMERPAETRQTWRAQAALAPAHADAGGPWIVGCHMWRGRADRQYLAFHQWELLIQAGPQDVQGLRMRLTALGADLQPMHGRVGHWVALGNLPAGGQIDTSYKLNTSQMVSTRFELAWQGGSAVFLLSDGDAGGLPEPAAALAVEAVPRVSQPEWQYVRERRLGRFLVPVRNEGGLAAEDVVLVLHLLDREGKEVHRHEHIPNKGVLPPGYAGIERVLIQRCPPFATVNLSIRHAGGRGGGMDPGSFSEAAEVEVAELRISEGQLSARVRNGTADDLQDVVVTLVLSDAAGTELARHDCPVAELAAGATADLVAEIGELSGVAGWHWSFATAMAGAEVETKTIAVDGLELTIASTTVDEQGLVLELILRNDRPAPLPGLQLDLAVGQGVIEVEQTVAIGDLANGASWRGSTRLTGLSGIDSLAFGWRSVVVTTGEE